MTKRLPTGHTRRNIVQHLIEAAALGVTGLGGTGLGGMGLPGLAKASDDPPFFETARHQFTIFEPRKAPPAVSYQKLDGRPASLSDWHGKVVLLNFWASWCPQCRTELPVLDQLQAKLDPSRYQVLAISTDHQGRSAVDPYLKTFNLRHLALGLDPKGDLGRPMPSGTAPDPNPPPFTIYGMPMSFVLDPMGRTCGYMIGAAEWTSPEAQNLLRYYAGA